MFIRIAGIELKPPLLQRFSYPVGGLTVWCEALEDVHDESGAKKLLDMKGFTQSVKWEDKVGVEYEQPMQVLVAETDSWKNPDGKKITRYMFTLIYV